MDGCRVVCMALDGSRMQVKDEYYPALPLVCADQVRSTKRRGEWVLFLLVMSCLQDSGLSRRRVVCVRERRLHLPTVVH